MKNRRLHLDAIGGVAGDMFAGAMLDLYPEYEDVCRRSIAAILPENVAKISLEPFCDGILHGKRFDVRLVADTEETHLSNHNDPHHDHHHHHHHHHRHWKDIRESLVNSSLALGIQKAAIGIFTALAEAEAWCHNVDIEDVSFHEVGAWDSIADILAAASIIDSLGDVQWTMGALPRGSGTVNTAHGLLPVPAPAVIKLLKGVEFYEDNIIGERITPTGAAIINYLNPQQTGISGAGRLQECGMGFGTRKFSGLSNMLRVVEYDSLDCQADYADHEKIMVVRFDVDDQTSEDLAVGLDNIREMSGVLDVTQYPMFGKKGRIVINVQIMVAPDALRPVIEACFIQTTTLGLRWSEENRVTLKRVTRQSASDRQIKVAQRPDGESVKIEMEELKNVQGGHQARERVRRDDENKGHERETLK